MPDSDFTDAVVHYRTKFPTLESLGVAAADWLAELNAVAPGAFDAITGTNISLEGGNVGGVLNFRQRILLRALHFVRAERDSSYTNPYTVAIEEPRPFKRLGFLVNFTSPQS